MLNMLRELMLLTLLPVALGMAIRAKWPEIAKKAEEPLRKAVLYLLFLVLGLGVLSGWKIIVDEIASVGLLVITMNLLTMGLGYGLARLFSLPTPQVVTITFEVGVQNLALSFAITFNILQNPDLAVAALVYAAIMPATALTFVRVARKMIAGDQKPALASPIPPLRQEGCAKRRGGHRAESCAGPGPWPKTGGEVEPLVDRLSIIGLLLGRKG